MKTRKNPFRYLIWFFCLLLFFAVTVFLYEQNLLSAVDSKGQPEAFVIKPGVSVSTIAQDLEEKGFVKSSLAFKILYKLGGSKQIESGDFKISKSMDLAKIIDVLTSGSLDKWVTLVEGIRVEEMAKILNEKLVIDSEQFGQSAKKYEGYLFPDTYLFNPDANIEDIIQVLRNTFDKKYDEELRAKIKAKGLTEEQGVILASLVEREGRSDNVRIEVASILLKRLKIGMKLDVDATVQYAKDSQNLKQNGKLDKFWQPVTKEDYSAIKSSYNTYLNNGLPPGPICNPSLSSLNAVANAHDTAYLYYYHDSKGNSYYATTLEEHNENVANYR